jgi:prepilin-type N-terminal cleavage/methylation domain-containing protein
MTKKGFSLIEIVMGLALFSMLMVTATSIMTSTIRTSRKSAAISLAKNEGASALKAMTQMLRYASKLSCAADSKSVQMTKSGSTDTITYVCDEVTSPHRISSSSATMTIFLTSEDVNITNGLFTCVGNTVTIRYQIDNVEGVDVTDKAATSGLAFQTMVTVLNTSQ